MAKTKQESKDNGLNVTVRKVKLTEIRLNEDNPRQISQKGMARLVKSIKEFPEMLTVREIVVDESMTVLGGNMRLLALQKAGVTECMAKIIEGLTEEQKREFIIKDNASFGEWDFDILANAWGDLPLTEWGIDLPPSWMHEGEEKEKPEVEFTEEIMMAHNYVVLYFDNELDWQVAIDTFGLKQVKDLIPRKGQPVGIGRVIPGQPVLKRLTDAR